MRTREELEKLINGSALFFIDRTADSELFAAEERRFLKDLTELMSKSRDDFKERGYEIMKTAKSCIRAYDAERGNPFLHYFNASLKDEIFRSKAKERADEYRGGLTGINKDTERMIRKILKHSEKLGKDINDPEFQEVVAETLGVSPDTVLDAISANANAAALSGDTRLSDDNSSNLFDSIGDTEGDTPEESAIKNDALQKLISSIDKTFSELQDRPQTKALLAKLLTAWILEKIHDTDVIEKSFASLTFTDAGIYNNYILCGTVPTDIDIAKACGMLETNAEKKKIDSVASSVSRTRNNFLKKLRESVKSEEIQPYI